MTAQDIVAQADRNPKLNSGPLRNSWNLWILTPSLSKIFCGGRWSMLCVERVDLPKTSPSSFFVLGRSSSAMAASVVSKILYSHCRRTRKDGTISRLRDMMSSERRLSEKLQSSSTATPVEYSCDSQCQYSFTVLVWRDLPSGECTEPDSADGGP